MLSPEGPHPEREQYRVSDGRSLYAIGAASRVGDIEDLSAPRDHSEMVGTARPRVLLVDDDNDELFLTRRALEKQNCEVVSAIGVTEALREIANQRFDVLITDLHMPDAGDGFAVVTAMRHTQPKVLTLVASDFPDVQRAMRDILLQADEVIVKPFDPAQLPVLIANRKQASKPALPKESVASILDRDVDILIQRWLKRVENVTELAALPLTPQDRTEHLLKS